MRNTSFLKNCTLRGLSYSWNKNCYAAVQCLTLSESSGHYDYECHDWWFSILSFANLCKSNHAKVCSPSQVSIDKRACKCKAKVPFKQPHFALGQCQELTIRPHAFELNLPKSNPEKVWTSSQVSLHKQAFKAMTPGNKARQCSQSQQLCEVYSYK